VTSGVEEGYGEGLGLLVSSGSEVVRDGVLVLLRGILIVVEEVFGLGALVVVGVGSGLGSSPP